MNKRIWLGVTVLFLAASGTARANEDDLLEKVVTTVSKTSDDSEQLEAMDAEMAAEATARANKCVAAVDAATAANIPASREIKIGYSKRVPGSRTVKVEGRPEDKVVSLENIRKFCASVPPRMKLVGIKVALWEAAKLWRSKRDPESGEIEPDDADMVMRYAVQCAAGVDAAVAAGIPGEQTIDTGEGEMVTLASAKATVCEPMRLAAQKIFDARRAAYEAELAPYRKALKGDKLKLLLDLYDTPIYGKGCFVLDGPAALKKSVVWYSILRDDNYIIARWITRQYKFKGDKLIVPGFERTGEGRTPPGKACP